MESMDLGQAEDFLAQIIQRHILRGFIRISRNYHKIFLVSRSLKKSSTRIYIRRNLFAIAGRKCQKRMFSSISSNVLMPSPTTIRSFTVP